MITKYYYDNMANTHKNPLVRQAIVEAALPNVTPSSHSNSVLLEENDWIPAVVERAGSTLTSNVLNRMAKRPPVHILFEDGSYTVSSHKAVTTMTPRDTVNDTDCCDGRLDSHLLTKEVKISQILWPKVILLLILHLGGVYGFYAFLFEVKWLTFAFTYIVHYAAGLGITAGAHRLWSHKSYKARLPLEALLMFLSTMAFQGSVITWVRDHRMHHKYSETDADPHNSKRGVFFSHMGWTMVQKHPDVKAKAHTIDFSDITNNPLLRFQHRYYWILALVVSFGLPSYIPTLWGEYFWNGLVCCSFYRMVTLYHVAFLINSWGHSRGFKPYDKNIYPGESRVLSYFTFGEGQHNYHHTFPWDYKSAEFDDVFNWTLIFIDFMAKIGWAYDLKSASSDMIRKRVQRTGDGSHDVWGWDDNNVLPEDRNATIKMATD